MLRLTSRFDSLRPARPATDATDGGARFRKTRRFVLAAGCLLLAPILGSTAQATTIETTLTTHRGDPVEATLSIDDATDPGNLIVTIQIADGASSGRIRSILASVADESLLDGLSITGDRIQARVRNDDRRPMRERSPFDLRVRFLRDANGGQLASFVVSHETEALTVDLFENQTFDARIKGDGGRSRNRTARASGVVAAVVPEPSTAFLMLLGLGGLAAAGQRKA